MTSVPVASWVRVWSMRMAISSPGVMSPETRCDPINLWVTLCDIYPGFPGWPRLKRFAGLPIFAEATVSRVNSENSHEKP